MQNSNNIIHESNWAISRQCGNKVHKIFLHDSYPKIQKEVSLLQLSIDSEADLSFDSISKHWVCKSDFMKLRSIVDNIYLDDFILQLRDVFATWKYDCRYINLISDEWSKILVPWYCLLLQQYIPNSEEQILWLRHSCGKHFVHGDLTLSNIYLDDRLKIIVIDYENATLGPFLWDETTLVYSFIEQKRYSEASRLYETFSCKKEMLQAICSIRLAQSIRKSANIKKRIEAQHHILHDFA